jgi:hypothetical protein
VVIQDALKAKRNSTFCQNIKLSFGFQLIILNGILKEIEENGVD